MKLAKGLYLNEENSQTFEIVDSTDKYVYIQYPDFFFKSIVHMDEESTVIFDLIFEGKISYIGEI